MCITACSDTLIHTNDMLEIMKKEENISVEMRECKCIIGDTSLLMIGMTGENEKTYQYYAAQFSETKDGSYQFESNVPLDNIGWQIRLCKWQNGYVIICNNSAVNKIQISVTQNGIKEEQNFDVKSLPWAYYLDMSGITSNYDIQYTFFDSDGNELN